MRTTEEALNLVNLTYNRLADLTVMFIEYEWDQKFFNNHVKNVCRGMLGSNPIDKHELQKLSIKELLSIGFKIWEYDPENKRTFILIPIRLIYCLNQEDEYESFTGKHGKLKDIDKDVRFSNLAYGFWVYHNKSTINQKKLDELEYTEKLESTEE